MNFDQLHTKVYKRRDKDSMVRFCENILIILIGICVGLTAASLAWLEEHGVELKRSITDMLMDGTEANMYEAWGFYTGSSMLLVLIASSMTVCWAPGATGSGIAELIAYLNGVNYPNLFGKRTFVTKFFGVILAVVGGLIVGKEGPLAHMGANIGVFITYLPIPNFEFFRNDSDKRQMVAIGSSAGVSAAFGAPIGGALFAYEISKPNTIWKFSVIWKTFIASAVSVFSLAIF